MIVYVAVISLSQFPNVELTSGEITGQSAEILYSSSVNIGGFQFNTDGIELTGASSDLSDISFSS